MKNLPHELYKYFEKWDSLNKELEKLEKQECLIKNEFEKKEIEILLNTDFKAIYGQNNEKVRKHHIKNELNELYNQKNEIKSLIASKNRELALNECLINAKIKYMR